MAKNTLEAMNLVANGLRWRPGDRVVMCDLEFPANASPWLGLSRKGVETVIVRSEGGRVPEERIIEAINNRTRLTALSWVQFSSGYRSDLHTIGQACHERGALLAVDVMQGLGALKLDVQHQNVDFFGAASHKWLLGPTAIGWVLLPPRASRTGRGDRPRARQLPTKSRHVMAGLRPSALADARRFEPGIANLLCLVGLEATLDLFAEVGADRIESQVRHLTDLVADGVVNKGYALAAPRGDDSWSGIVSFRSDRHGSEEVFRVLEQQHVVVSLRKGLIRVSPHFYNNEEDVERLLNALP